MRVAFLLVVWGLFGTPLATAAQSDSLERARSRLAAAFGVARPDAPTLRIAVDAVESSPEGRRRLSALSDELFALFERIGVPRAVAAEQDDALWVSCRVETSQLELGDDSWAAYRWNGTCGLSRRGQIGFTTARAGGASHRDVAQARARAVAAAHRALLESFSQRLSSLIDDAS